MASSPSSISGRRNRPGCMGGIAHLFDFNQALAGRKLLTDKKYDAGFNSLKNTPSDHTEQFNLKTGSKREIQFGRSASVSKKSSEVPIKALIAEEITHELAREQESKHRAPSVVARLMGLDALPGDSNRELNTNRGSLENVVQKVPSDRLRRDNLSTQNTPSTGVKIGRPPMRSVSDLSASRRSFWEEPVSRFEALPSENQHEFKGEYGAWKNWKSEDLAHMQALDDLDSQLTAKQMLIKKKLSEAKLGLLSKHSGPNEKLFESKEFMDAIEFLQANKDFFVRFLEEPDSLFAKHLRYNGENPISTNVAELAKHTRRRLHTSAENGVRPQSWDKEPLDSKKRDHKMSGIDFQVDDKLLPGGSVIQSLSIKDQHKHLDCNVSTSTEHHQAPTRIVVLKPGPGKVRNLMSLSPNSSRSPREFFDAMEVIRDNSMDVFKELKDKLQQEDPKGNLRRTRPNAHEQGKPSKDPREIAREIARQVRENVTRDLRANSKSLGLSTSEISSSRTPQLSETTNRTGSHELLERGYVNGLSANYSSQIPTLDRNPRHGVKEDLRKKSNVVRSGSWLPELQNGRNSYPGDPGQPSPDYKKPGVPCVDVKSASQDHSVIVTDADIYVESSDCSLYESETDAFVRNEDTEKDGMYNSLPRSKSVPASSSIYKSQEEFQEQEPRLQVNDLFVSGVAKAVESNRSVEATSHQVEPLRRSIFGRKGSGLRSSFSKSKKRIKQVDEKPFSREELPTQESIEDTCLESDKAQHQIDDVGPIPDSDSSVSSLDNFLTLEAALMEEEVPGDNGSVIGSPTPRSTLKPTVSVNKGREASYIEIVENLEMSIHSPSANDGTTSVNSEGSKGTFEQPSPVSVLDTPFDEDSESPMDFAEISSGLQDLRMRLQLLKFVDPDAILNQEDYQEEDGQFTDGNPCSSTNLLPSKAPDFEWTGPELFSKHMNSRDLPIDGIVCAEGKEPELMYMRNVLVASGFTVDHANILTRWHAPSQPLGMYIFQQIEECYTEKEGNELHLATRRLLFDRVNEVLLEVLAPLVNSGNPWKAPYKSTTLVMPCGKDLVREVWVGLCKISSSQSDTLGNLVVKDLAGKDRWHDFGTDIEIIVLNVERAIFSDLLQEILTVH